MPTSGVTAVSEVGFHQEPGLIDPGSRVMLGFKAADLMQ
jgi:hypothetical protein